MSREVLEKWARRTETLADTPQRYRVAYAVLAREAAGVVRFVRRYWEPVTDKTGKLVRPGLKSAAGVGGFDESIANDILELHQALHQAQLEYRLTRGARGPAPVERARFVIREIKEAVRWQCEDAGHERSNERRSDDTRSDDTRSDERRSDDTRSDKRRSSSRHSSDGLSEHERMRLRLDKLNSVHRRALSHDAIAAALLDYAALAELYRDRLDGVGGFDARRIEEARELSAILFERSANVEHRVIRSRALDLRNRIAALLTDRIKQVRSAARFVFRHHPEIVREATSEHLRKRRAEQRKTKAIKAQLFGAENSEEPEAREPEAS